jgi:hypothetical protein
MACHQKGVQRMQFNLPISIQRSPEICFAFLRDKHLHPQKPGSAVRRLEKVTPGPVSVGTRYVEVVQMFPFVKGGIRSVVTRFDPPEWLEEDFAGAGMIGHLAYQFLPQATGTHLIQRETLHLRGVLRLCEPLIRRMLAPQLERRLVEIRARLEAGWQPASTTPAEANQPTGGC